MPPVRHISDLVYGEVPGFRPLELDLYLPGAAPSASAAPVPVIVHVHGGGWRRGSRRVPLPRLGAGFYDELAARGFAVAAIDYRLSGEARYPAALEDVRAAIGWVREHAAEYGMDPGRVFAWGDSAGGHLALMAALAGAQGNGDEGSGSAVQGSSPGSRSPTWPACWTTWRRPAAAPIPGRSPERRCSSAPRPGPSRIWRRRPAR
jgi:acetyl esterase/lipase